MFGVKSEIFNRTELFVYLTALVRRPSERVALLCTVESQYYDHRPEPFNGRAALALAIGYVTEQLIISCGRNGGVVV